MKILVISGWYPSHLEPLNGDFVKEQIRLLRNQGARIDMVYLDYNIAYLKQKRWSNLKKIKVDLHGNKDYLKSGPFWPKNTSWGLKRWIKAYVDWVNLYIEIEGTPKVIHAHTYLGAAVAFEIHKSLNIPFLVTAHFTGWVNGRIKKNHFNLGIRALQGANKVVAVSSILAKTLTQNAGRCVDVSHNFIDTSLFSFSTEQKLNTCPEQVFKCLTVGDLIPRKQIEHTIEAVSLINKGTDIKVYLKIIGHGASLSTLKNLISELEQTDYISFLGRLDREEVAQNMLQSHLLIHSSSLETFGLVIAEALCCGIPVVTYDNQGVLEMTALPGVHLTSESNVGSLVKKITEVLQNYHETNRPKISEEAKKILGVEARYNQLMAQYESLLI